MEGKKVDFGQIQKNLMLPLKAALEKKMKKRKLIRMNTDKQKEMLKEKLIKKLNIIKSTPRSRSVKTKKQGIRRINTATSYLTKSGVESNNTVKPLFNLTTDDLEQRKDFLIKRLRIFGQEQSDKTDFNGIGLIKKAIVESNTSYIPDIVQRMKALEKDNLQLKKELEKRKVELRSTQHRKKEKTLKTQLTSQNTIIKGDSEGELKELKQRNKRLENQIKKLKKESKLKTTIKSNKQQANSEETNRLVELLKKNKVTVDKFLKKKILDLVMQVKKLKGENSKLNSIPENKETNVDELKERINDLEIENKRILKDYFNIKKMLEGNETYEDLLMYRKKVEVLQIELKEKDRYIKKLEEKSLGINFV